ncbi:Glu/Leu/Phe/Val dehydrogenase [Bordetella sp. BOR01]|uniref:Glu/Leu/Phe/Val family dehydrogenase n=1 Tax=Bordetella sp. BOR01 TaxID=2854779 RepID=UPI001C43C159|nr:Glu/Leu/Phe/Val dehydrogenase dimerization domain-containing protein [Bordetella sp. BOR01]MBV7482220.1 amino acid dehydrogenase [Bordetella sp. BOR01]
MHPNDSTLLSLPGERPHEQVSMFCDERSGLTAIIAIHNTLRGPAFGGCRVWSYSNESEALRDALRLSHGMSLKNALAGLPFGGGKAVILKPSGPFDRQRLFQAFGTRVDTLAGHYITAEDVGSTIADMRAVQQQTRFVSGIPRDNAFGGDPSPRTAFGVFLAIDEAVYRVLKRPLDKVTVAVQGLGAVGMSLCKHLYAAGARLVVSDLDQARVQYARSTYSAEPVGVDHILAAPCDVLAPCALGGVLNSSTVPEIKAAIVAGASNNQLFAAAVGDALQARGILYLPDFLINAGGIISAAHEYLGRSDDERVELEISRIRQRVAELLDRSNDEAPFRVAQRWAEDLLRQC